MGLDFKVPEVSPSGEKFEFLNKEGVVLQPGFKMMLIDGNGRDLGCICQFSEGLWQYLKPDGLTLFPIINGVDLVIGANDIEMALDGNSDVRFGVRRGELIVSNPLYHRVIGLGPDYPLDSFRISFRDDGNVSVVNVDGEDVFGCVVSNEEDFPKASSDNLALPDTYVLLNRGGNVDITQDQHVRVLTTSRYGGEIYFGEFFHNGTCWVYIRPDGKSYDLSAEYVEKKFPDDFLANNLNDSTFPKDVSGYSHANHGLDDDTDVNYDIALIIDYGGYTCVYIGSGIGKSTAPIVREEIYPLNPDDPDGLKRLVSIEAVPCLIRRYPFVSRWHCRVRIINHSIDRAFPNGAVNIEDMNSVNGTFVCVKTASDPFFGGYRIPKSDRVSAERLSKLFDEIPIPFAPSSDGMDN
ncbi:MAG: FHA domain-containing protein [Candidatus Gracilibacteria bacterium]